MTDQDYRPLPTRATGWWLAALGLIIILSGAMLAQAVRTTGGISVRDIRFKGADGTVMSALLYVPATATPTTPAPGILAVHGYINSRETQDGFAIEFARRGYVVLSLDQTGHGYSDGPAFSNGFGGPDGLKYLRSLPMVDTANIGLEGHSMGGWTVLAAAAAMPDAYTSIVLEGSSTGAPFAKEGSPTWPRNLSLVFSRYDEFSKVMWGTDRALDLPDSLKLHGVFGTRDRVVEGRIYGSIAAGTARVLHQPATTHPGDHISTDAIGHATDWFAATLKGGQPRPASDQIWIWKEVGTGVGLLGFVMILMGSFDVLVRLPAFAGLRGDAVPASLHRDRRWWRKFMLSATLPALLFFPAFIAAFLLLPASRFLPQAVTSQVTLWALAGAGVTLLLNRIDPPASKRLGAHWGQSILLAVATLAIGYAVLAVIGVMFHTDIRFWVVAVKVPSLHQWAIAAIYVLPLTFAFLVSLGTLCRDLTVTGDSPTARYGSAVLSMTLGFIMMLGLIYGILFATGTLVTSFDPLSTVIALQFVPILAAAASIGIFTWQRTGSHRVGALIAGPLVTLCIVAGTATQV